MWILRVVFAFYDAAAQANFVSIKHHRLPRRNSPLLFVEADFDAGAAVDGFDDSILIGLAVAGLGGTADAFGQRLASTPVQLSGFKRVMQH